MSSTPPSDPSRSLDTPETSGRVLERFLLQLSQEVGPDALVPADLARAVADVLPVEAAGITLLLDDLRLPLGASSEDARLAEQLQMTLGAGPCIDAAQARAQIVADGAQLGARWPLYAEELGERTPFRAVAAVPLRAPGGGPIAALDLFSTWPRLTERLDLHEVDRLATTAGALLAACLDEIHDINDPDTGPDWYQEATRQRHDVWVATGMLMANRAIRGIDALDLLRGHAYSRGSTLDQVAADLVRGDITASQITGS